ncbi:hypothetical protein [Promicromonospora sp. NPDC023805]|uniref:hypothetical protein n=1 Tax=Promicromonospora sp. NPDC023805 TaxID=3154696 RepID=UPI0033D39E45
MSTLRANVSFNVGTLIVHRGDLVDSSSTIIKGREHLFDAVETAVLSPRALETASAAPGTRRRRSKRAAKPKAPAKPAATPDPAVAPTPAVVPVDAVVQPVGEAGTEPVELEAGAQISPPADVDDADQEPADDVDDSDQDDVDDADQDDADDADQDDADDADDDQLPADDAGATPPTA